jgi:DNA-binding PadR family transcriptional regulator
MTQIVRSLHEDELIEPIAMPTPRGDDRSKVYAITDKGHADWEGFFQSGPNVAQLARRSLLVKIALAGPERLGEVLAQLDRYEEDCIERVNEVNEALDKLLPDDQLQPRAENVFVRLGVDADVYQLKAELAWARHARQMVSWLLGSDAIWPSARHRAGAPSDASQARRDEARQSILNRLAQRDRD